MLYKLIFLMLLGKSSRRTFVSSKISLDLFDRGRPLPRLVKSLITHISS
jgi:hypothetical protein